MARELHEPRCYNLTEAAEFLEYDQTTVTYWLRMGHLTGTWDAQAENWRVRPEDLLEFLRSAREPFPTGARARVVRQQPSFGLRPATVFQGSEELTD